MNAPRTHLAIDPRWVGTPLEMSEGRAVARLRLLPEMAADERGLAHGGFAFGLADYAAMLAVDDPLVVLAAAEVKFLRPTAVGQELVAEARLEGGEGKKRRVSVEVRRDGEVVLAGTFLCFVPERHVLEG